MLALLCLTMVSSRSSRSPILFADSEDAGLPTLARVRLAASNSELLLRLMTRCMVQYSVCHGVARHRVDRSSRGARRGGSSSGGRRNNKSKSGSSSGSKSSSRSTSSSSGYANKDVQERSSVYYINRSVLLVLGCEVFQTLVLQKKSTTHNTINYIRCTWYLLPCSLQKRVTKTHYVDLTKTFLQQYYKILKTRETLHA